MFKSVARWLVKKFITRDSIYQGMCALNRKIATVDIGERNAKVVAAVRHVNIFANEYLKAFANDGKITDHEVNHINAQFYQFLKDIFPDDKSFEEMIDRIIK